MGGYFIYISFFFLFNSDNIKVVKSDLPSSTSINVKYSIWKYGKHNKHHASFQHLNCVHTNPCRAISASSDTIFSAELKSLSSFSLGKCFSEGDGKLSSEESSSALVSRMVNSQASPRILAMSNLKGPKKLSRAIINDNANCERKFN